MSLPHSLFLVIFGASGDLTRRKLMPALVKIHNEGHFFFGRKGESVCG